MFKKTQKLVVDEKSGNINPYGVAKFMTIILLTIAIIIVFLNLLISLFV